MSIAGKAWLVLSASMCLFSACLSVLAGPRDETLAGISRCTSIGDDRSFLNCVYGAAQPLRGELGLPPAPDFQIRLVPPEDSHARTQPPTVQIPHEGGLVAYLTGGDVKAPLQRMTSYSFDGAGYFVVALSDGEIWRQVKGDQNLAAWRRPASDYAVTIRTGAFGTFNLEVDGEPGIFKVVRQR